MSVRHDAARLIRAAVVSPADAWMLVRMLGWALFLPALKARMPLERLVALMWLEPRTDRARDIAWEQRVARLSGLSHRLVSAGRRDNCLERSLIAYRNLSAGHADPRLVVGARSGRQGVEGHVWVSVDGTPVHDSPEEIATYSPITEFAAAGLRQSVG